MQSPELVGFVRTWIEADVRRRGWTPVADDAKVHHQVIRDFLAMKVATPRGANWTRLLQHAETVHRDSEARRDYSTSPTATQVREHADDPSAQVAQVIRAAQTEQSRWVQEFAARLLEASAQSIRAMKAAPEPDPNEPLPELAEAEAKRDATLRQRDAGRQPKSAHG